MIASFTMIRWPTLTLDDAGHRRYFVDRLWI
jgi:hypothetical protein